MKKGRSLICNIKDEPNSTIKNVIHYDIETYRKNISQEEDSHQTHEPYIVGYDLNDGEGYRTFQGDDCMVRFVKTKVRNITLMLIMEPILTITLFGRY
jgi:hypothetical protein